MMGTMRGCGLVADRLSRRLSLSVRAMASQAKIIDGTALAQSVFGFDIQTAL
jgi:hypothetical protein